MNSESRRWRGALAIFLAAACLWVINHPLLSIDNHDARIYSILALHWLNPEAYARDPFFLFGSQDRYSLFSPLYGVLIREFGLTVAASIVVLTGAVLWCFSAMCLALRLGMVRWAAIMSVLMAAVLSINYSPNGMTFLLNEGFATARSIAFPLGALALAACLYGRVFVASILAVAASLLHPLIGIWVVAVVLLWRLSARQIAILTCIGLVGLLILMLSEFGPFLRFDAEWEQILRTHTLDVFVAEPSTMRWRDHVLQLLVLSVAALHVGDSAAGRLYRRVLLVAVAAMLAAMFASLVWPSQIVIQAQLWRGMWLAAYLMPFALCHLLSLMHEALHPPKGHLPWALIAVLTAIFMLKDWLIYVLLLWAAITLILRLRKGGPLELPALGNRWRKLEGAFWLPVVTLGLMLVALPNFWAELGLLEGTVATAFSWPPQLAGLLLHGGVGLGFLLVALGLARYGHYLMVSVGLASVLVVAFLHWDMRSARDRTWEEYAAFGRNDVMTELVKPGDVVLWDGRLPLHAWYELRTAHYASPVQAIGMVFSREKTFELLARVTRVREAYAYEHGKAPGATGSEHAFAFQSPNGTGIPLLCKDPALDWVVSLPEGAPVIPGGVAVRNPYRGPDSFMYLFRCSDFREAEQRA